MDPAFFAILTGAVGNLVTDAVSRTWRSVSEDQQPVELPMPNATVLIEGFEDTLLTAEQVERIKEVLAHPNTLMLTEAACFVRVLYSENEQSALIEDIGSSFHSMVSDSFDETLLSQENARELWSLICSHIDEVLPRDSIADLSAEEKSQLRDTDRSLAISSVKTLRDGCDAMLKSPRTSCYLPRLRNELSKLEPRSLLVSEIWTSTTP